MDTLWPLRKVLVRYRVLEMAAAIALLLTFAPLLRDNPVIDRSGSVASASSNTELLPQSSAVLDAESGADQFLQPTEIAALVYANDRQADQQSPAQNTSASAENGSNASSIYSPFSLLKGMVSWVTDSDVTNTTGTLGSNNHAQRTAGTNSASSTTSASATSVMATERANFELTSLDQLLLNPLGTSASKVPAIAIPTVKASKWEVGPQATYQVWNIRTPVDMEFEQQAFNRWRGGSAFGLSANRTLGKRTSLGLGASVSLLQYDPNLPTVFNAADQNSFAAFDRTESFDGISINLAQVPVDFKVQLTKPEKRVNLTAFAGLVGNFTLSSDYDRSLLLGLPEEPMNGPSSELEEVFPHSRTFSDVKEFLPGVLEGGSLVGNTFLSGRLGLESSIELNDRISAFSSLSYSHFLPLAGGFGPNNDKLSAVGLTIGARVSL